MKNRFGAVTFTAAASLGARGLAVISSYISTPLLLHHLGAGEYGYWVTILSVVGMLSFADFGIGSGLINSVAASRARNSDIDIRRAVSNAFALFTIISIVLSVAAWGICTSIGFPGIQTNLEGASYPHRIALFLMSLFCLLSLPFSTVQRVQYATHEGYLSQIWQGSASLFALLAIFVATRIDATIPVLALCVAAPPFGMLVLNWTAYFSIKHRGLFPHLADVERAELWNLLVQGSFYFIMQIGWIVISSIDNLLVLHFFGPQQVTHYSLVARLFQIPNMLAAMWFSALWPKYVHLVTQKRMGEVHRLLRITAWASGAASITLCLFLAIFIRPIIRLWTGEIVDPSASLIIAFSLTAILIVVTSSMSIYLNASNMVAKQSVLVLLYCALSIPLAFWLPGVWGISGVAWSTTIGYLVIIVPAYCFMVPRLLRLQRKAA